MSLISENKSNHGFFIFMLGAILLLLQSACNKNCDDCTPVTHFVFGIRNTTNAEVEFVYFRNEDSTIINMTPGEVLETILVGHIGARGILATTPLNVFNLEGRSAFDSVSVVNDNSLTLYTAEECSATNPLCVESYEKTEDISSDGLITTEIFIYNYE